MARFQAACSARFNDLQHTSPAVQTDRDHHGVADEDSQRLPHQEEPGAFDLAPLLIYGERLVVGPDNNLDPVGWA